MRCVTQIQESNELEPLGKPEPIAVGGKKGRSTKPTYEAMIKSVQFR